MITSLLIANRGEIACRIIRTCRRLGIRAVAVYSDADARALHVRLADEAVHIGPAPATESYLAIERIIGAARRAAVDAIHPGYGFLAESAAFSAACVAAGLVFIGPTPEAIAALGDKHAVRELAARAGVPVLPGYGGADQSDAAFEQAAVRIGWPVMVKAAAGGGGKGMRLVEHLDDLPAALESARHEARAAFGSGELIIERALTAPRHIEVQIFGDQHGNIIHLGERECSVQRRHQKVIEEAPAPTVAPELRAAICTAAVAVAHAAGYTNAGTVEFLLDCTDRTGDAGNTVRHPYYFLEMNTRLQVEHPITECVTGLDLVEWQIRVAEGQSLPLRQEQVPLDGHAIEARLYAEDPANGFLPATGTIALWRAPAGESLRVESGVQTGDQVTIHYDPLLAKLVAHGPDRPTALRRLARALETTTLLGVTNNRAFLRAILNHPAFQGGALSTGFLAEHFAGWAEPEGDLPLALIAATLAQWAQHPRIEASGGYWRNNPAHPQLYRFLAPPRTEPIEVRLLPERRPGTYQIVIAAEPAISVVIEPHEALTLDGHRQHVALAQAADIWWVQTRAGTVRLHAVPLLPEPRPPADAGGSPRAPMPGVVLAVLVAPGQRVAAGDALLKLEAMKMEHTVRTAAAGVVEAIYFAPGDTVEADAVLVKIEEIGD
jgi:geranyl-CoA carboxylase alpha subunit